VIFFDIDDTLLNHNMAERNGAINFLHQHSGIIQSTEEEFIKLWNTLSNKYFLKYLTKEISFQEQRRARMKGIFGHFMIDITDEKADLKFEIYLECYKNNWVTFDDVIPCLDQLKGEQLGVISNGDYKQQIEKLEKLNIRHFFSHVITSSEVGFSKPDKRIFMVSCLKGGTIKEKCFYIGDRMDTDAIASKKAVLNGIWLNRKG
jgi:putative hydrolase of the HAD superfamily